MKSFSWVPNTITALNLCAGILSIFFSMHGVPCTAAWLIIAAAVCDFLDGMSARLLHAYSELGKQLDSLADVVSFGVAPAAILDALPVNISFGIMTLLPLLIPVAGAFRLAKFNIDSRQTSSFLGLPIPANALFFASLPLFLEYGSCQAIKDIIVSQLFCATAILLFSWLMVSEVPMFSLKFKSLAWRDNRFQFIFLAIAAVLTAILQIGALPFIIIAYILLSLLKQYSA
ncbi:MAG: CDP-diacylglycerol--serine O-phosphatidyltransferase [Bacteroidales bacterium]|jgi:CDP-diacylglycerol--serine O-phosphatidyltransferase|nr:CDP-diacylglycerol--serine O-phosphatidyltransferase [Bacteroidales bacterium]